MPKFRLYICEKVRGESYPTESAASPTVIENRKVKKLGFTFVDGVEPRHFRVYLDGIEISY